ncbi:MAG: hypothetical protein A2Z21_01055 [Candidatus Fraserbacteria bacterium RBG_16_55_9]|uniref:Alpha,alpha-trehalose-phosphate synthase n=1 Tax=Fraserbacteria sp. (strain RBG_16_55_9) TaxID=1817864 RepID=A0A1F5US72_FRAXR|nr:MAG: hypothetical protein A2Z21_01055 [Candidatus Fraserbacteria bacterium RBG_16_55_9]
MKQVSSPNRRTSERLIIVANRLPVSLEKKGSKLGFRPSTGGLATGLGAFYKKYEAVWIGWPGDVPRKRRKEVENRLISEFQCYPVFLPVNLAKPYYEGFANNTLWPLFHSFPAYAEYSTSEWEAYQEVNSRFCERIAKVADPNAVIWVHDYHLMLLPKYIRERMPEASIGFFLHIPFPSYDVLRVLPWHRQILESLLDSDLIGFHTYDYSQSFLRSVRRSLGYDHNLGQIVVGQRVAQADVFPMGIDFRKFSRAIHDPEVKVQKKEIKARIANRKLIFSVSRLDYTKGILQSLRAIEEFFQRSPQWHGKVVYVLVIVPSREIVAQYAQQKREIDELVGRINSTWGTLKWMPVRYLYRHLDFHELAALYAAADVALIIPLRDGMNLIAKEYLAARRDKKGALILSDTAGAAKELREALIVNPNSREEIAEALRHALSLSSQEQIRRNSTMRARLQSYDLKRWVESFLQRLTESVSLSQALAVRMLDSLTQNKLMEDYSKASRRLILLDYDGTLIPLMDEPEKARPTQPLRKLLQKLSSTSGNEVILLSGRDRQTLVTWFGDLKLTLVAEHGAWIRESKAKRWKLTTSADDRWKKQIRPILQLFVDRIPGSWLEEKELSLAWHYRKADAETGMDAAKELIDNLTNLTANLDLHVLPGNKVLEVKSTRFSKGAFYLRKLAPTRWDFLLAMGDDWTDETLFSALPKDSYSIRVGFAASTARFNLKSPDDVFLLLKDLAATEIER